MDHAQFIAEAQKAAKLTGACVLEVFSCPHCGTGEQMAAHHFCESVVCGNCKKTVPSKVPPASRPGEVTKENLMQAIRLVRGTLPDIRPETIEFCERQEGHVRCVGTTIGVMHTRKMLDKVEEVARALSGGHR